MVRRTTHLDATTAAGLTPLLQLDGRPAQRTLAKHLTLQLPRLAAAAARWPTLFLDLRLIEKDGTAGAQAAFNGAVALGIGFVPVTGISRAVDVSPALAHRQNGVAIRLTRHEMEAPGVAVHLQQFTAQHGLTPPSVDLILDLGPVHQMVPAGVAHMALHCMAALPTPQAWRSWILVAAGIPLNMGAVPGNGTLRTPRVDWLAWSRRLYPHRQTLARLPTYGDYAIDQREGDADTNYGMINFPPSIRYTLGNDWFLMKGLPKKSVPIASQLPQMGGQLAGNSAASGYMGRSHCAGCLAIDSVAGGAPGYGSLEPWRRIGTIHHLTLTEEQLAALPWP